MKSISMRIIEEIDTDVVVIGGGTAGVFAAVSAARCGADTILIERNGVLGGTMTSGGVNFPGLFFAWGRQIIDGPCWEAIERTEQLGGCVIPEISYKPQRHWMEQIRVNPFIWASVLDAMCDESKVKLMLYSALIDAEENSGGITIIADCRDGIRLVRARCAVDASGDACLAGALGCTLIRSKSPQPATLQNYCSGYDISMIDREVVKEECNKAARSGIIPPYVSGEQVYTWLEKGCIELHTEALKADTAEGRTKTELLARKNLMSMYKVLRTIPKLDNFCIEHTAAETGIRETVRIDGEKCVTVDEYLNAFRYDDAVCYAFYPVDKHIDEGVEQIFLEDGRIPSVPYGSMLPKGSDYVIEAGRCICSDELAGSALRVQAVCMAEGQAAGCAAALCAKNNISPRNLELEKLRVVLKNIGAVVPE